jgi:hypothetical protein
VTKNAGFPSAKGWLDMIDDKKTRARQLWDEVCERLRRQLNEKENNRETR